MTVGGVAVRDTVEAELEAEADAALEAELGVALEAGAELDAEGELGAEGLLLCGAWLAGAAPPADVGVLDRVGRAPVGAVAIVIRLILTASIRPETTE